MKMSMKELVWLIRAIDDEDRPKETRIEDLRFHYKNGELTTEEACELFFTCIEEQ